ncbi:fumarylacetoacetase [Sulfitobacter guttiformis]|uniref:fumarylacetoacetase n=1 Tax=Sulfitobacter guttiformis TaxID=74349 RepID=A0A420DQI8_9RHOB|nr:fumarylacetoacetase [Sulfitobacter guttiformis]KIN73814.1 Fumarylacetoacetase [Sulfitobacter guttiformis KCTC 32187]RKE96448.1 fumarylacetoacetate hydrolase [Sulfitobacter guttiformis]
MTLMKSWVQSANSAKTPFPLNNLPYGVFTTNALEPRCGVAIGDMIFDMAAAEEAGLIELAEDPVFDVPYWNDVMELGPEAWDALRARLVQLLADGAAEQATVAPLLVPMADARMEMPIVVAEFTDFYAGRHHATNVGTMFRGAENALPPNWLHIPIGYNGRASTVIVSGTDIIRPNGQTKAPDADMPVFGPCKRLDIELEIGAIVGTASEMGHPVSVAQADEMIFGYVLLNDWSARDIQAWEYQPLGPFQAKAFATSISPWIVTRAALEPFRTSTPARELDLLPHLEEPGPMLYDIDLSVTLRPEGGEAVTICETNYSEMYYSAPQQLAHHASSGCAMTPGDLLGSGTISGAEPHQRGSLLELSWGGKEPIDTGGGQTRSFIEDGDTLTLHGAAKGDGYLIGFGTCAGTIKPAVKFP